MEMDKNIIEVLDKGQKDKPYWIDKSPEERLNHLEELRQIMYGYNPDTERLQRVFEIIDR